MVHRPLTLISLIALWLGLASQSIAGVVIQNPRVQLRTNLGSVEIELYPARAPKTVKNFLDYVHTGFYNGTIFHRVIPGFMIQGGGFTPALTEKPTHAPIDNEADNGLKNRIGTIAMARTSDPNSATAQFFINTADNKFLNFRAKTNSGWGYCVFGRVIHGMRVVKKIEAVATDTVGPFENVPIHPIIIERASVVKPVSQSNAHHKPVHAH